MKYEIKISKSGKITRLEWHTEGYQLAMITRADAEAMFVVSSPESAVSLLIDNFDDDRRVEVVWVSTGAVAPEEATQFAENINAAARVAGEFNKIMNAFK